jgi:hypothetical protein
MCAMPLTATPPQPNTPPPGWSQQPSATSQPWGGTGVLGYGRVDVGVLVLLSAVTGGIFWLIWVYRAMRFYRQQVGKPVNSLDVYFWGTVISFAVALVLGIITLGIGLVGIIVGVVFMALLVAELIRDQTQIAGRYGASGITSVGAMVALITVANLLSVTLIGLIVGIPLAVWFYYLFFRDHNRVIAAMTGGQWR